MAIHGETGHWRVKRSKIVTRSNRVAVDFLKIDSEVALTFSGIALRASDEDKRRRTTQTARKAYDTIFRLRQLVDLTEAESIKLDVKLQRLKSELQNLGETFAYTPTPSRIEPRKVF